MARLAVTVTVFYFVLAFSDCSRVSIRPENDVFVNDPTPKLPEPEKESVIYGSGSEIPNPVSSSSKKEDLKEVTVPLTFVNFRPINRHFPKRPLKEFRFHRRPCRLHRHQPWGPLFEIPYGHDMIGEEKTGSSPVLSGFPRPIPTTWVGMQEEDEEEENESEIAKKILKKMHHGGYHYHHHNHQHEKEKEEEDRDKIEGEDHKEYKDWFMKKVRNFLKHQF